MAATVSLELLSVLDARMEGWARFFTLSQVFEGPGRYGLSARLHTIPSSPQSASSPSFTIPQSTARVPNIQPRFISEVFCWYGE